MLMRFSPIDIRIIPGIGPIMLGALAVALLAPLAAIALSAAALLRQPRAGVNWIMLAFSIAVFGGQGLLFMATRWM
jgi:branched-subunit amino acid ABC-type transport system permease component